MKSIRRTMDELTIDETRWVVEYKNRFGRVLADSEVTSVEAATSLMAAASARHPEFEVTARRVGQGW